MRVVLLAGGMGIVGIANQHLTSTFEANIGGTWTLPEVCRRSPKVKRIVLALSDKGSTLQKDFGIEADILNDAVGRSTVRQGDDTLEARLRFTTPNFAEKIRDQRQTYRERVSEFMIPIPHDRVV
jgi:hypothetical protein